MDNVTPPAIPQPEFLPLRDPNFNWERFESFCQDFISRLPGVVSCKRYGKRGNYQRGIDLIADLDNGKRRVFQCRQWKQYNKAQAERTVKQTTFRADDYIVLLACEATTKVQDFFDALSDWDVWDVRDVSLRVRKLPTDDARAVVENHFGSEWRKTFLGLPAQSPFVSPDRYFARFLNPARLFNHTWAIVGRRAYLDQLHQFVKSDMRRVAILFGRGGIGKTKVLHAFANEFPHQHENFTLRFVFENTQIDTSSADDLPNQPCVIVLDDAHRYTDLLKPLLGIAQQRTQLTKLLLSARPQGINYIQAMLTQAGFDLRETVTLDEVGELNREEIEELARQALDQEDELLVTRLAEVTKHCPLVTVVGGQLLAQKAMPLELLERDAEFREAVLTRFYDILVGNIDGVDQSLCRRLLEAISALSPVQPTSDAFQKAVAKFLDIPVPDLIRAIDVLENSGVFLRRGYTLRIVPDVLSDHILHNACLTKQGQPTHYANQLLDHFDDLHSTRILRNLAELDWRVQRTTGTVPNLLASFWQDILTKFEKTSNWGRCSALDALSEVAYFQPRPMLNLVEVALEKPVSQPDPEIVFGVQFSHQAVLAKLPAILHSIGYTLDYLPRCCDLLWELGRDDTRPLNPNPDHAMRILTTLANYDIEKPLIMNQAVLDAADRWLDAPDAHSHLHHPLDVVDPVLAKCGESRFSDRDRIVLRPFAVHRENTQPLRDQAVQLILKCVYSNNLRAAIRALNSLEEMLRDPFSFHGQTVSEEERLSWLPEQLRALECISEIAAQVDQPVVQWRILEILQGCSHRRARQELAEKARSIATLIPDTFTLRLLRALCANDTWMWIEMPEDDASRSTTAREYEQRMGNLREKMVGEFLGRYTDAAKGFRALDEILTNLRDNGFRYQTRQFMLILARTKPDYVASVCKAIVKSPDCSLVDDFDLLLHEVREVNENKGIAIAQSVLDDGHPALCAALATEYRWGRYWKESPKPADFMIFDGLLNHPDLFVRERVIGSLSNLGSSNPRLALEIAASVDIGNSVPLAKELFGVFGNSQWTIPYNALTDSHLEALLAKLERVPEIGEYHIGLFLAYASRRLPQSTLLLLLKRVDHKRAADDFGYHPIPIDGFRDHFIGFSESDSYEDLLREIRDRSLTDPSGGRSWLALLFREISMNYCEVSLSVLGEWISSGDAAKTEAIAHLLEPASQDFVLTREAFVSNLLERAYAAGDECFQAVMASVRRIAFHETRMGFIGQPFPQDVALRDRAAAARERYSIGSPPYQFYNALVRLAEGEIRDKQMQDEMLWD